MPVECRVGLSQKELEDIWVHGVYYAPASVIRRATVELRKDWFIFQKDNSDEWGPCPQYRAALGNCPELVRVENCLCLTAMADVLHLLLKKFESLRLWKPQWQGSIKALIFH